MDVLLIDSTVRATTSGTPSRLTSVTTSSSAGMFHAPENQLVRKSRRRLPGRIAIPAPLDARTSSILSPFMSVTANPTPRNVGEGRAGNAAIGAGKLTQYASSSRKPPADDCNNRQTYSTAQDW